MGGDTMRKGIVFLLITIFILLPQAPERATSSQTEQIIPDEAIRLRILANSDNEEDQRIKLLVRDNVNNYINELVAEIDNIEEARRAIRQHVPKLEEIVKVTLEKENVHQTYTVDYRSNVTFPTKKYGNYIYPAGDYEAVLITLGDGVGENWWCVLFPPLCFLDFSNDEPENDLDEEGYAQSEAEEETTRGEIEHDETDPDEESEDEEEVEVRFFLFDWLGLS